MLRDEKVIENFVTSDFHLFDRAVGWILQNNLLTGNRFCEFGAGFGVCTMLAALHGMESIGVEIESSLTEHASELAETLENDAKFYCGSFVPSGLDRDLLVDGDANNADTDDDGIYDLIGLDVDDFDLIFAFPWPAEYSYFEAIFDESAADGALLLTYRGREGMHLLRKV
ncbi:MAG: hypothetical protein AAGG48_27270 [Planctomycetota bacterium]